MCGYLSIRTQQKWTQVNSMFVTADHAGTYKSLRWTILFWCCISDQHQPTQRAYKVQFLYIFMLRWKIRNTTPIVTTCRRERQKEIGTTEIIIFSVWYIFHNRPNIIFNIRHGPISSLFLSLHHQIQLAAGCCCWRVHTYTHDATLYTPERYPIYVGGVCCARVVYIHFLCWHPPPSSKCLRNTVLL